MAQEKMGGGERLLTIMVSAMGLMVALAFMALNAGNDPQTGMTWAEILSSLIKSDGEAGRNARTEMFGIGGLLYFGITGLLGILGVKNFWVLAPRALGKPRVSVYAAVLFVPYLIIFGAVSSGQYVL